MTEVETIRSAYIVRMYAILARRSAGTSLADKLARVRSDVTR